MLHAVPLLAATRATWPDILVFAAAAAVILVGAIGVVTSRNPVQPLVGQRPLAVVFSLITLGGVLAMAATAHWVTGAKQVVGPIQGHVAGPSSPAGEPAQLGKQLFTTYLFAFEATAALLVIAVVGAVVLARRPPTIHGDQADDQADDPGGQGAGHEGSDNTERGVPA